MGGTDKFLLVNQVAEMLGVSANTVRAWAETGKLAVYRHPVNNYRLFKRSEVKQLLVRIQNPRLVRKAAKKA